MSKNSDDELNELLKYVKSDNNPIESYTEKVSKEQKEEKVEEKDSTGLEELEEELEKELTVTSKSKLGKNNKVIIGVSILLVIVGIGFVTYKVITKKIANDKRAEQEKFQEELKDSEDKESPIVTKEEKDSDKFNTSLLNKHLMEAPKLPPFVDGRLTRMPLTCNIATADLGQNCSQTYVEMYYNGIAFHEIIPYSVYVRMKNPNIVETIVEYYFDEEGTAYVTSITLDPEFLEEVVETYEKEAKIEKDRLEKGERN